MTDIWIDWKWFGVHIKLRRNIRSFCPHESLDEELETESSQAQVFSIHLTNTFGLHINVKRKKSRLFYIITVNAGLCNPETKLLELHQKDSCSKGPTLESDD